MTSFLAQSQTQFAARPRNARQSPRRPVARCCVGAASVLRRPFRVTGGRRKKSERMRLPLPVCCPITPYIPSILLIHMGHSPPRTHYGNLEVVSTELFSMRICQAVHASTASGHVLQSLYSAEWASLCLALLKPVPASLE